MSIRKIENKKGTVYRICIYAGTTIEGKQIRYTDTYEPPPGMSEKKAYKMAVQMEKELEEKIKNKIENGEVAEDDGFDIDSSDFDIDALNLD